jgi:glycine hydroxymethyltransferase
LIKTWLLKELSPFNGGHRCFLALSFDKSHNVLSQGADGARAEKVLDLASITLNKNSVPGDKSAVLPGGIRIGSPALTTRGFQEQDFIKVADFIHEGIQIGLKAKGSCVGTKLKDFIEYVESKECEQAADIADLRRRVESFASQFPIPGVETANLLQH